jgi:hypothetical protein
MRKLTSRSPPFSPASVDVRDFGELLAVGEERRIGRHQ